MRSLIFSLLFITAASLAEDLRLPLELESRNFVFKEHQLSVSMLAPVQMHETYIRAPDFASYTYSTEENRFSVSLQAISPSKRSYGEIVRGKFQELILKPFSDKDKNLFGQVEILRDEQSGPDKTFEYEGYLKKQRDNFSADLYSMLHESYLLRRGRIIKISCVVQGLQDEVVLTQEIYERISGSCAAIINSVAVEPLR